jgi:hypothetical protein
MQPYSIGDLPGIPEMPHGLFTMTRPEAPPRDRTGGIPGRGITTEASQYGAFDTLRVRKAHFPGSFFPTSTPAIFSIGMITDTRCWLPWPRPRAS